MTFFIGLPAPVTDYDDFVPSHYELVPVEQRHITLLYLGEISRRELVKVRETLELISRRKAPLKMSLHGLIALPSTSRPKHLAIRVVKSYDLLRLRGELRQFLRDMEKDRYTEYKPHITIASTRAKATLNLILSVEKAVRRSLSKKIPLAIEKIALYEAEKGVVEPLSTYVLSGLP